MLAFEHGNNRGNVLQVSLLQQSLEEESQLAHADAAALVRREVTIQAALEFGDIVLLALENGLPIVIVRAILRISCESNAARGHGGKERTTTQDGRLE